MPRTKKDAPDQEINAGSAAVPEMAEEDEVKTKARKKICKVKNLARANQTVYGVTGQPIAFGAEGIAEPCDADLEHLLNVPGYEGI